MLSAITGSRAIAAVLTIAATLLASTVAGAETDGPSAYWYEVPALNPGLQQPPSDLDRTTPQLALDRFIDAARDEDYARAAHYLDLSRLDPATQAKDGAGLAERLADVVERKLWIDWGDLSDRPDALVETGTSDSPLAGQPRKSQRLGILEAGNRPIVIRLNRIKPGDGDPVWVFAATTVERIPELHAAYAPGWFERLVPKSWNTRIGSWELRHWEVVALPLGVVMTAGLLFVLRSFFGWLAKKAPWSILRTAAAAARMPAALLIAAAVARIVVGSIVTFSGAVSAILEPVLLAMMIIGVALAILRAIDAFLDVVTERYVGDIDDPESKEDRQLYTSIYAVRRIVVLIAFVAGIGLLMQQLHLTQSLGVSLLASAGVLTVLLGIAGQTVLGNIFSSLQIAIAKPIRIGDSIEYEGTWAYVEAIYYTFVRLRTWDDRRMIVPVKYFVSHPFENYSMQDEKLTRTFDLVLDHDAEPDALREEWQAVVADDEDALPDENNKVLTMGHDHNGQTLRFYCTAKDASTSWDMHARMRETMLKWIRAEHPEWWPRERVVDAEGIQSRGGAVGDTGG